MAAILFLCGFSPIPGVAHGVWWLGMPVKGDELAKNRHMDGGNARRADHAANYALGALPPTQQSGYLLGMFALDDLKVGEWTMFEIDKLEHLHQQQVAVLCQ